MTPPRTTLRDRLVLASLSAIAVGILGWLLLRPTPPPEPIFKGHPLSWWMDTSNSLIWTEGPEVGDIRALGPGALRWLIYAAEHERMGLKNPPPPTTWVGEQWQTGVQWIHSRIPQVAASSEPAEGSYALVFLGKLGPDATPAIPTLVRIIESAKERTFWHDVRALGAARALIGIGPPAFPEYLRLLATRPPGVRDQLQTVLATELNTDALSKADSDQILDALIAACEHPNGHVRLRALQRIASLRHRHGFQPAMKPAVDAAIRLFSNSDARSAARFEPMPIYFILGIYGKEAAAAIPLLVELLDYPDPYIANNAAIALSMIDPTDKRVVPRMRVLLLSPDIGEQEIARDTLEAFGELPANTAVPP